MPPSSSVHLLELARYVVLNPVRAGLIAEAEEYPWSSLRATLGLESAPVWLRVGALLARFGSRERYLEFVREGVGQTYSTVSRIGTRKPGPAPEVTIQDLTPTARR